MEFNGKNKLTNKIEIDSDTENKLTAIREEGHWGEKMKELSTHTQKQKHKKLIDTDNNSMMITRGKCV